MNQGSNEVDLFGLLDDIKENLSWVAASVIFITMLAALYSFLSKPVFQTLAVLVEPEPADLIELNQPTLRDVLGVSVGVKEGVENSFVTTQKAFNEGRAFIRSSNTLRAYFELLLAQDDERLKELLVNEALSSEQNFLRFTQRFKFQDPGLREQDKYLKISFEFEDAALATQILNGYIAFAVNGKTEQVKASVELIISSQIAQWTFNADQFRTDYFADKDRRLLSLKEAAAIAKEIKQADPLYKADSINLGVAPPLYMMGEKALNTEIRLLQSRVNENEDAYIKGVPELLWKLAQAEKVQVQWDKVKYVEVDQSAIVPNRPIKPRKILVLAIGLALGSMVGVVTALIVAAARRRTARLHKKAATN